MLNKNLINFDLSNYWLYMSIMNFVSSFLFKKLSFIPCVTATLFLTFCFAILFSLASISTSFQLGVCPVCLRCCDVPAIFSALFSLVMSVWCSIFSGFFSLITSFWCSPFLWCSSSFSDLFLRTRKGYLVNKSTSTTTVKRVCWYFDFGDKDLVNIISKPYLL